MRLIILMIYLVGISGYLEAEMSELEARICPEKETYLLGEPIFLNIEIINYSSRSVDFDNSYGSKCREDRTKVQGARRRPPNPPKYKFPTCGYGGTDGGSCSHTNDTLQPGEKHIGRIFLNGSFSFDSPGTYKVQARREIEIYDKGDRPAGLLEAAVDFDIQVVRGTEAQLRVAFEQYVHELRDYDYSLFGNPAGIYGSKAVVEAITTMAPPFLEDVILQLSETTMAESQTIPALRRLNTERTRKRLVELAKSGDYPSAISRALALPQDPFSIDVIRGYMKNQRVVDIRSYYTWYYALWNIGLFGEVAVPCLTVALEDPEKKKGAIRGLGVSGCRAAVPILIDLLNKSQGDELAYIRESLAQLTHLAVGRFVHRSWDPLPGEYQRWSEWWKSNGATAEIFDTDHCSELKPLP